MPLIINRSSEAKLQEMWRWYRRQLANSLTPDQEPEDPTAPEVYVVKPQSASGIPGLDNDDEPGSDTCDIYKLDDSDPPALVAVDGFEKKVYNLSESDIDQDWLLAVRTKYGKWIALRGLGFEVAFGKLDEELVKDGTATLSVWTESPLADSGDNIEVKDWLLSTGDSLASSTKCVAVKYFGTWYVIAAECPET